jgi:hypothetical protein
LLPPAQLLFGRLGTETTGSLPAKGSSIVAQSVSTPAAFPPFCVIVFALMQTRCMLMSWPLLIIAACDALERTCISQSGARILTPELTRSDCDEFGLLTRTHTGAPAATARLRALTVRLSMRTRPSIAVSIVATAVPVSAPSAVEKSRLTIEVPRDGA